MAAFTVTDREHNVIGNRRQDIGWFSPDSVTEGEIYTTLHWIESVEIIENSAQLERVNVYKNSTEASADEDDPGVIHIADGTSAMDGGLYQFIATGW